jgi:hypothetical protein
MASPESEDEPRPPQESAHDAKADEPAWPPAEARPEEASGPTASDEPVLTKPAEPTATAAEPAGKKMTDEPASEPKQEMGLSESTLHWLVDAEKPVEPVVDEGDTSPHYDPRAPVAGRKRQVAVIGGAAVLALIVAGVLKGQAASHRVAEAPVVVEPAAEVTKRAEAALAQGRSGEAMELARLAIGADARFADAYIVVGKLQRDTGRLAEAKEAYRRYLELAPLGTHAQEARDALATMPP